MARTSFSGPVASTNGFIGSVTGTASAVTGAVDASGSTMEAPQALVGALPAATTVGRLLVVTDANSGAGTLCFSDGTDWIDVKTGLAVVA